MALDEEVLEQTGELAALLDKSDDEDEAAATERAWVDPCTADVHYTALKAMALSPAHYVEAVQRGQDETLCMRLGSGGHAVLFGLPFAVFDGVRNKKSKKWIAFQAEHPGVPIMNPRESAIAHRMVDAIHKNDDAVRLLLTDTVLEQQIKWTLHGRPASSRPDAYGPTHHAELKTTFCADPRVRGDWDSPFGRIAKRLYYHAQASMYGQALAQLGLSTAESAYVIAVESSRPHTVTVMRWTDPALAAGDKLVHLWMERLNGCARSNVWPGYVQSIADLDLFDET